MEIQELIDMGNTTAQNCMKRGTYGVYYTGEKYAEWLSLTTRFLEVNFPGDKDTVKFRELSVDAYGNGDEYFHKLISILNAFKKIPTKPVKKEILELLQDIFMNFQKFDISIKRRYGDRSTIIIGDEYDLQDALFAILKLFVDDIRKEEFVPSYAGSNSRVDFLLPEYELIVETKMTNASLKDKNIGEQLILDFSKYKELSKAKHLVCFVYDKDSNINNPQGLIKDLEKLSDETMLMTVFIFPR